MKLPTIRTSRESVIRVFILCVLRLTNYVNKRMPFVGVVHGYWGKRKNQQLTLSIKNENAKRKNGLTEIGYVSGLGEIGWAVGKQ